MRAIVRILKQEVIFMDKKCRKCGKTDEILDEMGSMGRGKKMTDPQGMYTGVPENPYEEPVQDADDL